ncbi:hypothetical protein ACFPRL_36500 [Pseudoclavibacter helvolus]
MRTVLGAFAPPREDITADVEQPVRDAELVEQVARFFHGLRFHHTGQVDDPVGAVRGEGSGCERAPVERPCVGVPRLEARVGEAELTASDEARLGRFSVEAELRVGVREAEFDGSKHLGAHLGVCAQTRDGAHRRERVGAHSPAWSSADCSEDR